MLASVRARKSAVDTTFRAALGAFFSFRTELAQLGSLVLPGRPCLYAQ
jgi:hypothetical protein